MSLSLRSRKRAMFSRQLQRTNNWVPGMFRSILGAVLGLGCISCIAAETNWRVYTLPDGFAVALPSEPNSRILPVPGGDGPLRMYESIEPVLKVTKFSIFVNRPEKRGMFEPASIDAFLTGHLASMILSTEKGQATQSRRTTFHGQPALEYQFTHEIAGQPYVGRGVTFAIDGGYMRLSMWHAVSASTGSADFQRFVSSFKLTPIAYRPAPAPFRDKRGITFIPPEGWIQKPIKNQVQVAFFSNLTRSLQVSTAASPSYSCANIRSEFQASGRMKSVSSVTLSGRSFIKLVGFEDIPKYNVRLTTVHYCLDSRLGAVGFGASEEEAMFPRWAEVFEGAAATLRVQ